MLKPLFISMEKTCNAERFVNIEQVAKIDVFNNGSVRLWLTTGEEVMVSGSAATQAINFLTPTIAALEALDEQFEGVDPGRAFAQRPIPPFVEHLQS